MWYGRSRIAAAFPSSRVAALVAALTVAIAGLVPSASASGESDNPWLARRVMNMAHAGGESEAPADTLYAFKRAVGLGSDMIELDVQSTSDDRLVVMHNPSVDQTTNGTGLVHDMTFAQVHALDAAYNFVPGRSAVPGLPPSSYPLRGVRTHRQPPPPGYEADDFAIPSLDTVLATFPHVPVNIEIKGTSDTDPKSFLHNAELLATTLNQIQRKDIIVTSFNDAAVARFHELAPGFGLAPGQQGMTAYFSSGTRPIDGTVALQIPVNFNGIPVATKAFIARAHEDGYAVHVWFSGTAPENEDAYNTLVNACADGVMAAWPQVLENLLDQRGIIRPGRPGLDPCRD
jgi:glycerophosphoryl diester phosphodiesterase